MCGVQGRLPLIIKWTYTAIRDLVHLKKHSKFQDNSKQNFVNQIMHLKLLGKTNIQAQLEGAYWLKIYSETQRRSD